MVEKKMDYIDITPKGVEDGATGQAGKNSTVFQTTEWKTINENPRNLTKEGIDYNIGLWKKSVNRHVQLKYITMRKRCNKIAPSGVTEKGHIIFARDNKGKPEWTSENTGLSKPPLKKEEK